MSETPRFFLPRAGAEGASTSSEPALVRVLDVLSIRGRRVVVCRDLGGVLVVVDEAVVSADLRPALVQHEVARGRPPRALDVDGLYVMSVELLEQPGDTPGENDPVQLSGTLSGPFRGPEISGAPAGVVDGSLLVSRGDLLRGFGDGVVDAFHADTGVVLHAMLPGGRAEDIVAGRDVVLAYPCFDDASLDGGSNEAAACAVVVDCVTALRDDVKAHKPRHPWADAVVPVVSRVAAESDLRAQGFEIEGDVAVKRSGGLFKSVIEQRAIPPELHARDLAVVVKAALAVLAPNFPDARSRALFDRLRGTPATTTPTTTATTSTTAKLPKSDARDWMADFSSAPLPQPTRKTTLPKKTSSPAASSAPAKGSKPSWMKDFE